VILRPSVFEVVDVNGPQPSTSAVASTEPEQGPIEESNGPQSPEDIFAVMHADKSTTASPSEGPLSPNSTAAVIQNQASNQAATVGNEASISSPLVDVTPASSSRAVSSTDTLSINPDQVSMGPPPTPDETPKPSDAPLLPAILHVPPESSGLMQIDDRDVAGPSGTKNESKEEPWTEKYLVLVSLFPQSNPKFLEERAKQLYDKDEEFNLFVETTLEELHNPAPEVAAPLLQAIVTKAKSAGTSEIEIHTVVNEDVAGKSGVNAAGTSANNSTPSSTTSPRPDLLGKSGTSLPGPSGANKPGTSQSSLLRPSALNLPGTTRTDLPGTSGVNLPGSSRKDLPGPSGTSSSAPDLAVAGPSGLNNGDHGSEPWSVQHSFLMSILPDADPTYLEEKAKLLYDKEEELKTFVTNALENKDYPTLKDYQRRQEFIALQNKYLRDFDIETFLDIVPEPFKYFSESTRKPSIETINRGLHFLKRK